MVDEICRSKVLYLCYLENIHNLGTGYLLLVPCVAEVLMPGKKKQWQWQMEILFHHVMEILKVMKTKFKTLV